ncbi:MAG: hypothetical protein ABIR18_00235, partial [Chitinophagaceae bacterium]
MQIDCTKDELLILEKVAAAAHQLGVETYLIGGFVRDKIMGRRTSDADIVCIGDGIELATEVAKHFNPTPQVNYFKNFGTAHIKVNTFKNNDSAQVPSMGGDLGEAEG